MTDLTIEHEGETLAARFWPKVDQSAGPDGCWPWQAFINSAGYGLTQLGKKSINAHRVAVLLDGRTIPAGMYVDHMCRNRSCVNPAHLRVVTPRQNVLENSAAPTAVNAKKTHCIRGHPLSGENIKRHRLGRMCRQCCNDGKRRARARKKHGVSPDVAAEIVAASREGV